MTFLIYTAVLTAVWAALFATLDLRALAFGAVVSAFVLWGSERLQRDEDDTDPEVVPRPLGIILLQFAFLRELFLSSVAVAVEAWKPQLTIKPGILALPLEVESDIEVTVLASLISLTPGTLSLEVSPDKKTLYVHALDVDGNGDDIRESIHARLEDPVRRAFYRKAPSAESTVGSAQ